MLASPFYHRLHIVQLRVMSMLSATAVWELRTMEGYAQRRSNRVRAWLRKCFQIAPLLIVLTGCREDLYVSQYFPPEMGAPAARAAELSGIGPYGT